MEAARSLPRVGMATLTTVRSSTVMIVPRMTTPASTRISRFSRSLRPASVALAVVLLSVITASREVGWLNSKSGLAHGASRAEEGTDQAAHRRHRVPAVRRPRLRPGNRCRDRPGGAGRGGDGLQLLRQQRGPVLLAARGLRGLAG